MNAKDHDHSEAIRRTLRAVREHLGLDVAFVSEFMEDERVFRFVDSGTDVSCVEVGASDPMEESYCHYVVRGELPQFLQDPGQHPLSATLPATAELPVGTHLSVPIRFSDGRTYGTFCCFGHDVHLNLEPSDIRAMRMMAALVGEYLEEIDMEKRRHQERREVITKVLADPVAPEIVFQPLVDLVSTEIVSVEALARFPDSDRGPAWFFTEASDMGLGVALELKAVAATLEMFDQIPPAIRLNLNVSPETLISSDLYEMIRVIPPGRLVVEVTEHAAVDDYEGLRAVGKRLSDLGIRMSIDDVGVGFSGLNRILETPADELKIDRAIVRDVHLNPVKQAMIEALVSFCARSGLGLVAEGIETEEELEALRSLRVPLGQGFYFARPTSLPALFGARKPKRLDSSLSLLS